MNATLKHFKRRENVFSGTESDRNNTSSPKQKYLNKFMVSELASELGIRRSHKIPQVSSSNKKVGFGQILF